MAKIKLVVGANYGDEGKGLATRYFTRQAKQNGENYYNVLFNGSSQRGHTVEIKENDASWVFHHLGSGTFDGASTICTRNFILNPMDFSKESVLVRKDKFYVDGDCRVVTPYDIILNQIVELSRGESKHGSCGNGVWETKVRYECSEFNKTFAELIRMSGDEIESYLKNIASWYTYQRLLEYNIRDIHSNHIYDTHLQLLHSNQVLEHYVNDLINMIGEVNIINNEDTHAFTHSTLIFEGGQGLALDENNYRMYPHVTASRTGAAQIAEYCELYDIDFEVCYVTRTYFTRHGVGYLPTECSPSEIADKHVKIFDKTNKPNPFQDAIRYGRFDYNDFIERIDKDYQEVVQHVPNAKKSIMLTHLNEVPITKAHDLLKQLDTVCDTLYVAWSQYAEDVKIQEWKHD